MAGLRMLDAEVSLRCDESWNTGLAEVGPASNGWGRLRARKQNAEILLDCDVRQNHLKIGP